MVTSLAWSLFVIALPLTAAHASAPSRWTIQDTPDPPTTETELNSVSCASASACMAVGRWYDSPNESTLAERWNGNTWQIVPTVDPLGSNYNALTSVACPGEALCVAVGQDNLSSGMPLVERWDGGAWNLESAPLPRESLGGQLVAVACAGSTSRTAVGDYITRRATLAPLAERWDGSHWSIGYARNPKGSVESRLWGVSCDAANACTAVGAVYGDVRRMLVERWDGANWSIQRAQVPPHARDPFLDSVSCVSATCVAVGSYYTDTAVPVPGTLVERWDGSTWSIVSSPTPAGALDVAVRSVSCTSEQRCMALGYFEEEPGVYAPFAERWNGATWRIQLPPVPPGDASAFLDGVSCTNARTCTAVGSSSPSRDTTRTLAERYAA